MKCILTTFLLFCLTSFNSQTEKPCYQTKRICNYKQLQNCKDLVAFDERSHTYLSRKDYTTPFTGRCATCYNNGQLQESIIVVNGKRDSIGESYYESGCIQSKQTFVLGKLNGLSTFYYDSTGKKEIEVSHFLDKLDGQYILFENNFANDTLKLISYKANQYHGTQKEYYPGSKLMKVVNYKDGLLHGKFQNFDVNGKLETDLNYQLGKKHGKWTYFYPHGTEARLESWNMGVKDGEFRTNNEKGDILTQEFFKKGIPEGTHIINFPNGKPRHITVYEKGEIAEEHEFEELTGAKHTIKERVLKEKDKKKLEKNATVVDDDPDDLLGEKAAKKEAEEAAKEAAKRNKKGKKKKN
jgi:hypothetical protein